MNETDSVMHRKFFGKPSDADEQKQQSTLAFKDNHGGKNRSRKPKESASRGLESDVKGNKEDASMNEADAIGGDKDLDATAGSPVKSIKKGSLDFTGYC